MMPTASDRAAVVEAVERLTEAVEEVKVELGEAWRRRSTTRVRIENDTDATVTIKSKRAALRRLEIEYPISVLDAEALLSLRDSGMIEKTRFTIPWQEHAWEVDVFSGDNAGLVIAEIELRHEDEAFDRPPWLGVEITGQSQYYNGSLARHPFRHWVTARSAAAG